jgi:hypothetical protein
MTDTPHSIITAFDLVWARLAGRLSGLTDDEYFWEPVAGCWSIRRRDDGRWHLDGNGTREQVPVPVPVTTIAWRLGHLGGPTLGGFANRRFGDGAFAVDTLELPEGASQVRSFLKEHYGTWRDGLLGLEAQDWTEPLGAQWGALADATTVDLALHVFDEMIHHGAEVGVLRDLWSAGLS